MEKIRVSKLMSEQGLCSRREADSYIERGWVLVDGQPVTELGTRIHRSQNITSDSSLRGFQYQPMRSFTSRTTSPHFLNSFLSVSPNAFGSVETTSVPVRLNAV